MLSFCFRSKRAAADPFPESILEVPRQKLLEYKNIFWPAKFFPRWAKRICARVLLQTSPALREHTDAEDKAIGVKTRYQKDRKKGSDLFLGAKLQSALLGSFYLVFSTSGTPDGELRQKLGRGSLVGYLSSQFFLEHSAPKTKKKISRGAHRGMAIHCVI